MNASRQIQVAGWEPEPALISEAGLGTSAELQWVRGCGGHADMSASISIHPTVAWASKHDWHFLRTERGDDGTRWRRRRRRSWWLVVVVLGVELGHILTDSGARGAQADLYTLWDWWSSPQAVLSGWGGLTNLQDTPWHETNWPDLLYSTAPFDHSEFLSQ